MAILSRLIENHSLLISYIIASLSLSFFAAVMNFVRFYYERRFDDELLKKGERRIIHTKYYSIAYAIRSCIYDFAGIAFGYLLVFLTVVIVNHIVTSKISWDMSVLMVLVIFMIPYSIFCIAGRGIEVLNRLFVDVGVSIIEIGWKGIIIKIGKQDTDKQPKEIAEDDKIGKYKIKKL